MLSVWLSTDVKLYQRVELVSARIFHHLKIMLLLFPQTTHGRPEQDSHRRREWCIISFTGPHPHKLFSYRMLVYFYASLSPIHSYTNMVSCMFLLVCFPLVKMEPRASCMLNKCSSINPISQSLTYFISTTGCKPTLVNCFQKPH